MPQIATQPWNASDELISYFMMSKGISITSENLSESFKSSIKEFFGKSEVMRRLQHSHAFAVDTGSFLRKPLSDTLTKVHSLLSWGENWNSYRTPAPDPNAIAHAESWIVSFFETVEDLGLPWIKPSVTPSPEGEVVFEWWYREKKLTIYVGDQSADYVQVWGIDVHAKITDGEIKSIDDCRSLWMWLTS